MPATNPRLTITLKPATAALMRRLSELTGQSQSAMICELLETNEPVFTRLITVLQAAKDAKVALTQEMRAGLDDAQERIEQQLGLVLEAMDTATAPLLEEAERVQRRGARRTGVTGSPGTPVRRGSRPTPTPPSNRGVRSTPKKAKKPTTTRG